MTTTLQNPPLSPASTRRAWQTSSASCFFAASASTGCTWLSQTSWQGAWVRSTWPRPSSALRQYSSSPTRTHQSSLSWVLARILPVIWWSSRRGLVLVATSWSFLPWGRDKRRWLSEFWLCGTVSIHCFEFTFLGSAHFAKLWGTIGRYSAKFWQIFGK